MFSSRVPRSLLLSIARIFVLLCLPSVAFSSSSVRNATKTGRASPEAPSQAIRLPDAVLGSSAPYSELITFRLPAGMTPQLTFSFGSIAPPPWLRIPDPNRPELQGDLSSAAAQQSCAWLCHYVFHVIATDSEFKQADQMFELTVRASPQPSASIGSAAAAPPRSAPPQAAASTAAHDPAPPAVGPRDSLAAPAPPTVPGVAQPAVGPLQTGANPAPPATPPAPVTAAGGPNQPVSSNEDKTGGTDAGGKTPPITPVIPPPNGVATGPMILGRPIQGSSQLNILTTKNADLSLWSFPSTAVSACDGSGDLLPISSKGVSVTAIQATDTQMNVSLTQPLAAGTSLCVAQRVNDKISTSKPQPVQDPFNYGRVRMSFVGGVLVSNTQSSFSSSSASQFLSFNIDKTWRLSGCNGIYNDKCSRPVIWPGISTYFETRLTSIPVVPQATTQVQASSGSNPQTATSTPNPITSQKTARVGGGVYLPFVVQHWGQTTPNAFVIAPIAKVGFDTLTGATTQTNVTSVQSSGNTQTPAPATAIVQSFNRVYNFHSFGGRLAWQTLNNSRDRAPDPVALFDLTFGPYSSLESFICHASAAAGGTQNYPGSSCNTGNNTGLPYASRKRIYRFDIEGLITVPHTPISLGFNANIGQRAVGSSHLDPALAPGDDVRFLFGTKFDLATTLQKLGLPSF